jgi:hypothetical protein
LHRPPTLDLQNISEFLKTSPLKDNQNATLIEEEHKDNSFREPINQPYKFNCYQPEFEDVNA